MFGNLINLIKRYREHAGPLCEVGEDIVSELEELQGRNRGGRLTDIIDAVQSVIDAVKASLEELGDDPEASPPTETEK